MISCWRVREFGELGTDDRDPQRALELAQVQREPVDPVLDLGRAEAVEIREVRLDLRAALLVAAIAELGVDHDPLELERALGQLARLAPGLRHRVERSRGDHHRHEHPGHDRRDQRQRGEQRQPEAACARMDEGPRGHAQYHQSAGTPRRRNRVAPRLVSDRTAAPNEDPDRRRRSRHATDGRHGRRAARPPRAPGRRRRRGLGGVRAPPPGCRDHRLGDAGPRRDAADRPDPLRRRRLRVHHAAERPRRRGRLTRGDARRRRRRPEQAARPRRARARADRRRADHDDAPADARRRAPRSADRRREPAAARRGSGGAVRARGALRARVLRRDDRDRARRRRRGAARRRGAGRADPLGRRAVPVGPGAVRRAAAGAGARHRQPGRRAAARGGAVRGAARDHGHRRHGHDGGRAGPGGAARRSPRRRWRGRRSRAGSPATTPRAAAGCGCWSPTTTLCRG